MEISEQQEIVLYNGITIYLPKRYKYSGKELYRLNVPCVKAFDTLNKTLVLIEKVEDGLNSSRLFRASLFRLYALFHLKHQNIQKVLDIFTNPNPPFKDLYIVMDFFDYQLSDYVISCEYTEDHCKFIIYQILKSVMFLHSIGLKSCCLTPSNILINSSSEIMLTNPCSVVHFNCNKMTHKKSEKILSFQSPEIFFYDKCTEAADIWRVGCIFAELFAKIPLFCFRTKDRIIWSIINKLGFPDDQFLANSDIPKNFRNFIRKHCSNSENHLEKELKNASMDAKWLIRSMLELNPQKRLSAEEYLKHPYFREYVEDEDFELSGSGDWAELKEIAQLEDFELMDRFIIFKEKIENSLINK
jgi:serine/threonine protein kinase